MALLSIVFVFLVARYTLIARWWQRDNWVAAILNQLAAYRPSTWWAFIVMPVGCSLLLLAAWWSLGFWLSFFLGVLLLLYSVGRGDWHNGLQELTTQLRDGNAESVLLQLEERGLMAPDNNENPAQALWWAWCRYAGGRYLDRLFAVFFWFFIFGPVGAVFYRWVVLYNAHKQTRAGHLPSAKKIQHLLEWLPVRYMGLCICLAGNFTTGFSVWRQYCLDKCMPSVDFLAHCLNATLVLENNNDASIEQPITAQTLQRSPALEDLVVRTEIIGLVGLAVAILVLR